jgi:hypothetical protein
MLKLQRLGGYTNKPRTILTEYTIYIKNLVGDKTMNKKVLLLIVAVLLFLPFRLPIGIVLLNAAIDLANIKGQILDSILMINIVTTKVIYDLILSILFVLYVESLSRDVLKRESEADNRKLICYWWTFAIAVILFIYTIYDGFVTYELFKILK